MITVAKDNSGDFTTVSEALRSIQSGPETIYIRNGVYKERLEITIPDITLVGEDPNKTIITNDYYAEMIMEDGTKRGTFRTYTCLVFTHNFTARNITFENSAGSGPEIGQALAMYCEGDMNKFYNCRFLGHQDTLFTGPLPPTVKIPGGFVGPTEFAPRDNGRQYYKDCYICGDVDFIFGSATAYFKNCTICALDRGMDVNGYITAPSTPEGQPYGYVFDQCTITGNCPDRTVYLGRPWRSYAKSVFLNCRIDGIIFDEGFHDWNKPDSHEGSFFAEYNCTGAGADTGRRASFAHVLTDEEAAQYTLDNVFKSL